MSKHTIVKQNMLPKLIVTTGTFVCVSFLSHAQSSLDTILNKLDPQRWSATVEKKVGRLQDKLIAKSEKTLHRLQKQEEKIYRKQLTTKDSAEAKAKLAEIQNKYKDLERKLKTPASIISSNARQYIPHLDTLNTAFKFLNQNDAAGNIKNALAKIESFDNKLQQAEEIKNFIRERRDQLRQELGQLGLLKELKKYNKEVYYYSEQIKEYKHTLSDPNKIEKKAIELLSKTKLFQDFMRKNSMLASLFRMPGDPNDPTYVASLAGLQTRTQVNNLIQQQIAAGGPNAQAQFQQNIQQAQSQLQQLKDKIIKSGSGSSDDIIPEGFKTNNQKVKSWWKRIELGANIQSQKAQFYFPVTSDLGLSVGYKLNDKSVIGIGASYKLGLGRDWNHIKFSNQGVEFRSYFDLKVKNSIWITGCFEYSYLKEFKNLIQQIRYLALWQQGALFGITKKYKIGKKENKSQLLYDFLASKHIPKTHAIIFRIGLNL